MTAREMFEGEKGREPPAPPSVIDGLNAAWTLAHSRERVPVPPYLLTDAVREIERLRDALKLISEMRGQPSAADVARMTLEQ